ncbi:terminase small subunit [Citrobacter arsenatis]|uniref:terminase small subunit n=1 Tax=Citrobacter arsenatis TaxID=2546350 RepID=UPI00300E5231
MSKPDWGSLQQRYIAEHSRSGISPAAWCEANELNYATARRYIKKPPKNAQQKLRNSAQKSAQENTAQTAQKKAEKSPKNSEKKKPKKISIFPSVEDDPDLFDPDEFGITEQQSLFAQHVAEGKNLADSYRLAGYQGEGNSVHAAASRLLRNVKVSRAVRWLRDRRQKRLAITEEEIIHQLSAIASMDANVFSQIRRVNCRYCWGDNHQYQWRDVDEYERACATALAGSKPPPAFDGGIGFADITVPNEACPRCNGEGIMQLFFPDTTQLEGPERWAYLGVEETMNGLKVKTASPEAARKELMAYLRATKGHASAGSPASGPSNNDFDVEWKRLRNEKLQAEIENIRNGRKESNLVVVHNALQVPGAVQPTQHPPGTNTDGE